MNADTHFHFIFRESKDGGAFGGWGAASECHTHGAGHFYHMITDGNQFLQVLAFF